MTGFEEALSIEQANTILQVPADALSSLDSLKNVLRSNYPTPRFWAPADT